MDCRTQLASLAIEELDKGDFLMATKILTTHIKIEPNNHELYFERSICRHKLGDYQASLEDANTAIRLNATDYNIHYQKGLALIGLSMFSEAVTSFKKAIELRAKQDDSKLSDIFKLLRDATNELNTARRKPGLNNNNNNNSNNNNNNNNNQMRVNAGSIQSAANTSNVVSAAPGTSNDPVDSTTDKPSIHMAAGPSAATATNTTTSRQNMASKVELIKDGSNNLVAKNRNNQAISNLSQLQNVPIGLARVSSTASHPSNHHHQLMPSMNVSPELTSINHDAQHCAPTDAYGNTLIQHDDSSKGSQFEWNIRRSERIFLHASEQSASGPQFGVMTTSTAGHHPSSVVSSRAKRPHETSETLSYQQSNKIAKYKDGTNSHADSDVDVDDSYPNHHRQHQQQLNDLNSNMDQTNGHKRVMIAPSSSMPATTNQGSSSSSNKEDSYSSKYKRLRRDRERARRGTSKLCTIKPSDLEELQRSHSSESGRRFMRVIAPIDGWLYSGQLTIDDSTSNNTSGSLQYVVKLDGDATESCYLFSQETVLNDVIKEVKVKSVSELRKGARICCYWSRQYKCLSTGVVTSRTFEATKSLVSVKYDNGDLSALPLEDLRLLPPDYPKYMSNCDPLLLARNGDEAQATVIMSNSMNSNQDSRNILDEARPAETLRPNLDQPGRQAGMMNESEKIENMPSMDIIMQQQTEKDTSIQPNQVVDNNNRVEFFSEETDEENEDTQRDDDDDATIPPTDEIIDFITSETLMKPDKNDKNASGQIERVSMTQEEVATLASSEVQPNDNNTSTNIVDNSRASSEENNYGIEYRPWMFNGLPKRSKRHGRAYRDYYSSIRRGNEIISVGDSAELMPRDESILPFIAKIVGFWSTARGEMKVRVRWYYRLAETEGEPYELKDGDNALFETDHEDENDVQSIYRSTRILSWTEYSKNHLGHINENGERSPKVFYLAGYYDPVRRRKHIRGDVAQ